MTQLTVRDHMLLEMESTWWKFAGAKESRIREVFSMTPARYYQVVNALIDRPEAEAAYPMVVRRLRRLRSARQAQRSARRITVGG